MDIIPSIYIRDQKTVKLDEGGTIYDENPLDMAKALSRVGAEYLYLSDLNTPAAGSSPNLNIIESIVKETGIKVQLTGNIRSADTVERYLKVGVSPVILGSIAYQKPDFLKSICDQFPGKIAVHIDVRGGKVVIKGYTVAANKTPLDYAMQFKSAGVGMLLYSDVENEGKITPDDIDRVNKFSRESPLPIIHATDITQTNELDLVLNLSSSPKIFGTIIGKSMYSGIIDIASTITHVKEQMPAGMDEPTLIP